MKDIGDSKKELKKKIFYNKNMPSPASLLYSNSITSHPEKWPLLKCKEKKLFWIFENLESAKEVSAQLFQKYSAPLNILTILISPTIASTPQWAKKSSKN